MHGEPFEGALQPQPKRVGHGDCLNEEKAHNLCTTVAGRWTHTELAHRQRIGELDDSVLRRALGGFPVVWQEFVEAFSGTGADLLEDVAEVGEESYLESFACVDEANEDYSSCPSGSATEKRPVVPYGSNSTGAFRQDIGLLTLEISLNVVEDRHTLGLPQGRPVASWQDRRKGEVSCAQG